MVADSSFLKRELSSITSDFEVIETHISYIILTTKWAYKIKKSLKLPFLDFSTLENRQYFCRQELNLNQRLAPQMYLSVLPILEFNQTLLIGNGPGNLVDVALKMKRMDNGLEMDQMLQSNQVQVEHIRGLAHHIADFHTQAEIVYPDFSLQHFQALFNPIVELCPSFEQYLGEAYVTIVETAVSISDHFIQSNLATLHQRKGAGLIRDLHGDLHCKNIFLTQPPTIFDCIEFDSSLRHIDVLDEIAFLVMDLEAMNQFLLAEKLYDHYLNRMDKNQLSQVGHQKLFTYYKMYRANIRAKVMALQAISSANPEKGWNEVRNYLNLIDNYTTQLTQ